MSQAASPLSFDLSAGVLIGSGIGILPLVLVGLMGQRSGLTTMVLARGSYGSRGAKLPSLVNLLTLLAWSWIQALLAGMSLNYAVEHLTGYSNLPLFTILCETLVLLIALALGVALGVLVMLPVWLQARRTRTTPPPANPIHGS